MSLWCREADQHLVKWRQRARDALGISTAIGHAIGGAAPIAINATAAVAQGIVRGARNTSSANTPPPPAPDPEFSRLRGRTAEGRRIRANSAGDISRMGLAPRPQCDHGAEAPHTYTGTPYRFPPQHILHTWTGSTIGYHFHYEWSSKRDSGTILRGC